MNLHKVVEVLGDTREEYAHIRSLEGRQDIDGQPYTFKAYTIGEPQNIIRIDLRKSSEKTNEKK